MGQFAQNSFALLNRLEEGTPEFYEARGIAKEFYDSTIQKQIFLSEHGVPFNYTDNLSSAEIDMFIDVTLDWLERKNAQENKVV